LPKGRKLGHEASGAGILSNDSAGERCEGFVAAKPATTGTERDLVKVATFNINNINKRLDNLLAWLAKAEPDVVSLQELKAEQEAFPVNALRALGYEAVWQGFQTSRRGEALFFIFFFAVRLRFSLRC
jgi:hypothetical protein